MLLRLVQFSLRHRGLVLVLALLVLAYGSFVATRARLDVFPEFTQPQVDIQTEAPGLAPEQVEQIVTRPVESAVMGTVGLDSVRSESIQGLSVITAVFKEGTDIHQARQNLSERLAEMAGQLPAGVNSPKMSPLTSSTMDLLKVGIVSDKLTPRELRTFADWTLRPRLAAVPGVAKVTAYGGEVRAFQIQVRPEKLRAWDLSLTDVLTAARMATGVRGAGFIETDNQRLVLETQGQALTAEQLGKALVTRGATTSVPLSEVATVTESAEPAFGDARIMGRPGVLLAMAGQFGANTLETTLAVEEAVKGLEPLFASQGITVYPRLHRPATFIENALTNVSHALALGGLFVGAVLLLFLRDWRTALISFLAIPLSLLAALLIFQVFGATLNTMTLGGFAVAIGVVVDDAIIDVENILRRMRENAASAAPRSKFDVVLDASLEVRSAVVYATFIVAVVFVPVLMMSGLQGRFFAPLGHAFILATMASLVVALTVTPALCLLFLKVSAQPRREPFWLRGLRAVHHRLLAITCAHPRQSVAAAFLLLLASLGTLPWFGAELLPEFREGHFVAQVNTLPGTSLPEMMRLGERISKRLLEHPRVATVEQQAGRAEQGEDTWGPHRCELHIELKPGRASEEAQVQEEIREILSSYPGTQNEVLTFLGDRIGETLTGETAQVVINLFGDDLDALDRAAGDVASVLHAQPGAVDVQVKSPPGSPRIVARLKPRTLLQHGYRAVEVLEAIQTAYQGTEVGQVFDGGRVIPVTVVLPPEVRSDPQSLGGFLIANGTGMILPLRELADVFTAPGRFSLFHDGSRRLQTVTCNVKEGNDITAFVKAAEEAVQSRVKFPPGVYAEWSGEAEQQSAAQRELFIQGGIALIVIVMLLSLVFRRARQVGLVLANIPFALVGGLLAALASGGLLSIGSLVGFVTLFGISMRNSIMMISHYEHLVEKEGRAWTMETVLRGAEERFLPIVMTALVTGLGLLPLALGKGEAGSEIEGPMATVILGGLISSTVLNLIILPAIAWRWGGFGKGMGPRA